MKNIYFLKKKYPLLEIKNYNISNKINKLKNNILEEENIFYLTHYYKQNIFSKQLIVLISINTIISIIIFLKKINKEKI